MTETGDKPEDKKAGLGDIVKTGIKLLLIPIMWLSAIVHEAASYYYHGGCSSCHQRASLLNKWQPDLFKWFWGLLGQKDFINDDK